MCTCLPLLGPLGRKFPGRDYFRGQYYSAVSVIRDGRRKSRGSRPTGQDVLLRSESGGYLELEEAGYKKSREVIPHS